MKSTATSLGVDQESSTARTEARASDLRAALEDIDAYMEYQPLRADTWSIGTADTPYIGSLRIVVAELRRLQKASA